MRNENPRIDVVYDFRGETKKSKCEGTVSIRIYYGKKKRQYVSTGVRVSPECWNERLWVVRRDDAVQLNNKIKEQLDKCVTHLGDAGDIDIPSSVMKVNKNNNSFTDWLYEQICKQNISEGTRKHHMSMYNVLVEYGKIRRFDDITNDNINDWIYWLQSRNVSVIRCGKKTNEKISQTTVHDHWKRLHKYINIAKDKNLLPYNVAKIKVARGTHELRTFLNDEEIEKIRNVELPNNYLAMARDRFLVQIGTGLSFVDMMTVDFSAIEEIEGFYVLDGKRVKTNKEFFCVILPIAKTILDKWDFVVPTISLVNYNIYLQEIADILGIKKKITSHVGRHTYACYCLRHGVRTEALQRSLGHSKIATTQIYARLAGIDVLNDFKKMK